MREIFPSFSTGERKMGGWKSKKRISFIVEFPTFCIDKKVWLYSRIFLSFLTFYHFCHEKILFGFDPRSGYFHTEFREKQTILMSPSLAFFKWKCKTGSHTLWKKGKRKWECYKWRTLDRKGRKLWAKKVIVFGMEFHLSLPLSLILFRNSRKNWRKKDERQF